MTDLPHFALPFHFASGGAAVVEQDTADEILTCVLAVMLCPRGFRVELPTFGVPDPTFTERTASADVIEAALAEWEPRSQELVTSEPDSLDALISHVLVRITAPTQD